MRGYGGYCNHSNRIFQGAIIYPRIEEVADLVLGRVTQEMNEQLTKEFQKEETIQAVRNMHPTKAPGADDMSDIFYQKYWDVI